MFLHEAEQRVYAVYKDPHVRLTLVDMIPRKITECEIMILKTPLRYDSEFVPSMLAASAQRVSLEANDVSLANSLHPPSLLAAHEDTHTLLHLHTVTC